ncbi:MAG: serine hydrolase domain-containing protein [Gaiellaceae bacterium]
MEALHQLDTWPALHAAAAVVRPGEAPVVHGEPERIFRWASLTKLLTGMAGLVALEEGIVDLDEPAGPPGSTLRHVLSHASGLPLNQGAPIARVGQRRIYSNTGIQAAADAIELGAEMPFHEYLRAAVTGPLGFSAHLTGSPAWGFRGTLADLARLAQELLEPTLVAPETLAEATAVTFPGLIGVLPGFGRMETNDWGLVFELRDGKSPHWTGARNSPRTFGHFGASGTFLWVDPDARVALACLTDLEFDAWAKEAWPRLSDAVLEELEQ